MSSQLPPAWDESRIRDVIDHYENQSDEEAAAEDARIMESKNAVVQRTSLRSATEDAVRYADRRERGKMFP